MGIRANADIEALAEFMQSTFPAARLVALADGMAALAPSLWGRYQPEPVHALSVEYDPPTSGHDRHTRSNAT